MSNVLGLIQQALLFGFIVSGTVSLLSLLITPRLTVHMNRMSPPLRASLLATWSAAPLLLAVVVIFLAFLPSLLQVLGISTDHCLGHLEGHLHFCLVHGHPPVDSLLVWGLALACLGLLLSMILHLIVDLWEMHRFNSHVNSLPQESSSKDLTILKTNTPLALTTGLLNQRIVLSTGLVSALTDQDRAIILAHERAHIKRKDTFTKLFARSFSLFHLPSVRLKLLRELELAFEQSCDNSAAEIIGDRSKIAELLLKVERIYQGHFPSHCALASGVHDNVHNTLPQRISSLLDDQNTRVPSSGMFLVFLVLGLLLLSSHDQIHDLLEHLTMIVAGF